MIKPLLSYLCIFAEIFFMVPALKAQADEASQRLEAHVRTLAEDFSPRTYTDQAQLKQCRLYIEKHFRESQAEVSLQAFEVRGMTYYNISALFGDPSAPRWIVGAHYDTHIGTPGADDNASGVAGLLELSRRLGALENPPNIELVAYCLEEPPFFGSKDMGSYIHAQSLQAKKVEVRGMLALEMIGYFSDQPNSQHYPVPAMKQLYPTQGNFIAVISRLDQAAFTRKVHLGMQAGTDLPIEFFNAPASLPGIDFSDHRNYWIFGYPAVMITDTAFMRNQEYHGEGDTPDRLDYKRMAQVIDGLMHFFLVPNTFGNQYQHKRP